MTQSIDTITNKVKLILDSLPLDLARGVVFAGLSLNPVLLEKAIETAIALNLMRVLDKDKVTAASQAEKIVADAMENFQETQEKKKRVRKKTNVSK